MDVRSNKENGKKKSIRLIDETRFEFCRLLAGMKTDREVAEKMGVTPQYISKLKRQGWASQEAMEALADALDCSPIDLMVTEGFAPPKLDALVAH